jgi:hypothetical protein
MANRDSILKDALTLPADEHAESSTPCCSYDAKELVHAMFEPESTRGAP